MTQVVQGILIPFLGTTLGAACALFLKNNLPTSIQRILTGFAAGIMTAASVWSLLIPALEQESDRGRLAFLPAAIGFLVGIAFLLLLDRLIPHLHMNSKEAEGIPARLKKTTMLVFAVTLHNIPEGMAVGVVYAGVLYKKAFDFRIPSARSGIEIIAPSGKFWMAIPSDNASAPAAVIEA